MAYTNSSLVSYTNLSPNCNKPRNHEIDTITIHCYVAQVTAKRGVDVFTSPSKESSCNYVVGYDGKIGLCVEEKNRAWTSNSKENDHRAVTIEVASDNKYPYKVKDEAYAALIDLVTDICKRNNIKKLVWSTNKKDRVNHLNGCNMTVHRDYNTKKTCPGDYLFNKHGEIAEEVNKRLGVSDPEPEKETETDSAVKENDVVSIADGATYYKGGNVPGWVRKKQWIVADVNGDRAVLGKSTDGKNNIQSAINTKYLIVVKDAKVESTETATFKPYTVKVTGTDVTIRQGAGTNTKVLGYIKPGVYTIVEERNGTGANKWGKLKSGAGWIALDYVIKV